MATALATERSLAYAEPPVHSSKDFVEVQASAEPSERGLWWGENSRFSISLSNLAQNEFLDPNRIMVEFGVAVVVPKPATASTRAAYGLRMNSPADAATILPGTPAWGCPFFSSVNVSIPGLGLESFLQTDGDSQSMTAARLMCSAGTGKFDLTAGPMSYSISGAAEAAGARGAPDRAKCVWADQITTDRNGVNIMRKNVQVLLSSAPPTPMTLAGSVQSYCVPLSLFSQLFNQPSARFPAAYMASGGDLLTLTFSCAPASSALNDISKDRADLAGAAKYFIVAPKLSYSKLQVNSPSVLAAIEALYRGTLSIPVAPGVSAPAAMVYKTVDYAYGSASIPAASGQFQLTIPANQPSCRGILLQFQPNGIRGGGLASTLNACPVPFDGGQVGTQWNGKHAFTLPPRLRNLQVRIGSFRIPLDPITDSQTNADQINGTPFAAFGEAADRTLPVPNLSAAREAHRLYKCGRHLFSPFASEENPHDDAMSCWLANQSGLSTNNAATKLFAGCSSSTQVPYEDVENAPATPNSGDAITNALSKMVITRGGQGCVYYECGNAAVPGIFVLPFESAAAVYNHRDDAFALRGLDLRNITSVQITGQVEGVASAKPPGGRQCETGAPARAPGDTATLGPDFYGTGDIGVDGWTLRAWLAYDRMAVLLPGRIDLSSQFSLLPAGATSVPSSGNPAM